MRDISSYDVKKVKFAGEKENLDPAGVVEQEDQQMIVQTNSKTRKADVRNKKVDDFKSKKDTILGMLDLNSSKSDT